MLTGILLGIIILLLIIGGIVIFSFSKKIEGLLTNQDTHTSFQLLNQNLNNMHERLDRAAQVIQNMGKELGGMQEIGRSMQSLSDVFKTPKMRGSLGEQILTQLLEQYLPHQQFALQHKFHNGQIVDAIIKTSQGLIPVDAKFPLENFQKQQSAPTEEERERAHKDFVRDVKKHIQDIAKKYILPEEGTVDFALIYIPSEAVYYEILHHDQDIQPFAHQCKVFPVSPNSFVYYLRIIMIGMEGIKIQESSRAILKMLSALQQDAQKIGNTLSTATAHTTNAKNILDRLNSEYITMMGRFENIRLIKEHSDETIHDIESHGSTNV